MQTETPQWYSAPLPPAVKSYGGKWRLFFQVILFALTGLTTLFAGLLNSAWFYQSQMTEFQADMPLTLLIMAHPVIWINGILFAIAIFAILGSHELGHYLACRRYDLDATLPYFLPFPSIIGTLGAFIRVHSPIPGRRALFDIGVAGPIAGFVVTLPVLYIGLSLSVVTRAGSDVMLIFGESLLLKIMAFYLFGDLPAQYIVQAHPLAFAGWFGLLVTAFNLLPVGQLDGGHILYALMGDAYRWVGRAVFAMSLLLAFWWQGWLIWSALFLIMGFRHPRLAFFDEPLGERRIALAWLALAILILSFIPVPVRIA